MEKDPIFIHVPKTGGTTINAAMKNTYWQTKPDFNYRHIDGKTFTSNAGDIFRETAFEKYKENAIFMMLRDPVDRIVSEYYFIRDRKGLMDLFSRKPKNLEEYIQSQHTANGVLKFLTGHRMYTKVKMQKDDLNTVIDIIDNLPVHVGIFEHYAESLQYFSDVTSINWQKKLEVKRITFKRPKLEEIDEALREEIIANNELDVLLYEHCKRKFENILPTIKKPNIQFDADKYNHVIPYCYNWCFFEFWMTNKLFIQKHLVYFKDLTMHLIKDLKITDGRIFAETWIQSFYNSIQLHFPDKDLTKILEPISTMNIEPLEKVEKMAVAIDSFFEKQPKQMIEYSKPMKFESSQVALTKADTSGFLSKLGSFFK